MYTISIDLGGTFAKIGLLNNGLVILKSVIQVIDNRDFDGQIKLITSEVNRLIKKSNIPSIKLHGVAFAFPGVTDMNTSKVTLTHKFPTAVNFDFKLWAIQNWKVPIVLINDARMAGYGEWKMGAGKGIQNMVMITLGTGIGSFAVVDGNMLKGNGFMAGNISGHLSMDFNGGVCECGHIGCSESLVSSWKLSDLVDQSPELKRQMLVEQLPINFKSLFDLYQNGNQAAMKVANYCMRIWGLLATNLIHAYGAEVLVMGGGIMKSSNIILPNIRAIVNKHCWIQQNKVSVEIAKLGDQASLIGGYYLVQDLINNIKLKSALK